MIKPKGKGEKMNKGVLAVLMAMILSVFSMQMTALAETGGVPDGTESTEENTYGDAIVTVSIENPECLELSALKELRGNQNLHHWKFQ